MHVHGSCAAACFYTMTLPELRIMNTTPAALQRQLSPAASPHSPATPHASTPLSMDHTNYACSSTSFATPASAQPCSLVGHASVPTNVSSTASHDIPCNIAAAQHAGTATLGHIIAPAAERRGTEQASCAPKKGHSSNGCGVPRSAASAMRPSQGKACIGAQQQQQEQQQE
mmetsp:Transcript_10182/g.26485  ORF Transcript_10182/g.26485 Transcript_10182/m.26485 type:complete len:171 (+) Transcript_10182:317-829(+)|eukprot:1144912-Pelagomonas_calceolata.AAC.7